MRYAPFVLIATLVATVLVFVLVNACVTMLTNRGMSTRDKIVDTNERKTLEAKNDGIENSVNTNGMKAPEVQSSPFTIIPGKSVGQIILGMTKEEVLKALGKPTELLSNGVVYKSKKTNNYLKIHLAEDKVVQVDFTSKDFKTADGIHTGNFREERYISLFDIWEFQHRSYTSQMTLKTGGLTLYTPKSNTLHIANAALAIGVIHVGTTPLREVQGFNGKEMGAVIPKIGPRTSTIQSGQAPSPSSSPSTGRYQNDAPYVVRSSTTLGEDASKSANSLVTIAHFVLSGITLVVGLVSTEKIRKKDTLRLTTPLFYELDEAAIARFSAMQKACETLSHALRIWRVETNQPTFDWKRNAGASSLITRKLINVEHQQPPCIATNVDVWSINVSNYRLFFFPDYVFVWQDGKYGAVSYESLDISFSSQRFIEDASVPGDANIVDYTWRYVNKKGGPDRRFSNNRQLPIAQYGLIELRSSTGMNLHFHVSNIRVAEHFCQTFLQVLRPTGGQQQWQEVPPRGEKKQFRSETSEAATHTRSAYEILGVSVSASSEEIVAAYHQMAKMYHPDRLAHLAPEFVALAEERMKEINAAYEELKQVPRSPRRNGYQ